MDEKPREKMNYKSYCERIYSEWRSDPTKFADFDSDFNVLSLPEPYFPLIKAEQELIVLNNNPGQVLPFQSYQRMLDLKSESETYAQIADWLQVQYSDKEMKLGHAAKRRNRLVKKVASVLGFEGIENVETFFLHSRNFNKNHFLKHYQNNDLVTPYTDALEDYLNKRTVVLITAVSTKNSISINSLKKSNWIKYQTKIAGLDLSKASIRTITKKGDKVTSAVVWHGSKYMICNMGTNNIPTDAADVFTSILD